ncbi:MAG: site-2 protease family protein [Candidatus Saccharimonadales bacterium]
MDIGVIGEIITIIAILAVSITTHEFMHGFIADRLGDDTARLSGRLTLNPLKHVDPFLTVAMPLFLHLAGLPPFGAAKPVPFNPSRLRNGETGMVMVSLAGPLTNLVLALLGGAVVRLMGAPSVAFDVMMLFVIVNLAFFIFNLIPFPPLDGSRALYVLAPEPVRQLMRTIESTGLLGVAVFIMVGFRFIGPFMGSAIGILTEVITGVRLTY